MITIPKAAAASAGFPVLLPFTIVVSGAEQARYYFAGMKCDAEEDNRPLHVPSELAHLKTGDYSIQGMESLVTVERKSVEDLFGTLSPNTERRERFKREHERMAMMQSACVVIEGDWASMLSMPPLNSQLSPKSVFRTYTSWYHRFGVPWFAMGDRRLAEVFTLRFLQKFWEQNQ